MCELYFSTVAEIRKFCGNDRTKAQFMTNLLKTARELKLNTSAVVQDKNGAYLEAKFIVRFPR